MFKELRKIMQELNENINKQIKIIILKTLNAMKKKKANQYIKSLNLVPSDATGSL